MTTIVHLELQISPTATRADIDSVVSTTLVATRQWPGNLGIDVLIDDADATKIIVVEEWATAADHDAYVAWRATPEGANELGTILAGPPSTRTFTDRVALRA